MRGAEPHARSATWATGTNGKNGCEAIMQGDGNFVLYDCNHQPLWASGTSGANGSWLAVQDDGNLVVYGAHMEANWATGTNGK